VLGRYDYNVTPTNRQIVEMLRGRGMTVEGAFSFIDARDAGEIYALAIEKGNIGERYILSADGMRMKKIGKMVTSLSGKWVPHFPFPRSVNIASGRLLEMIAKLTGRDPLFTEGVARELSHQYAIYDNSKTLKDFDYKLYSMEETLQDTIRWFSFIGKIRVKKSLSDKFQPDADWLENCR
jgi:dihydroflavonol-4-reductase